MIQNLPPASLLILGRQPALGLAEVESLYGTEKLTTVGGNLSEPPTSAILGTDPQHVNFNRLGGTVKLARLLERVETADWDKLERQLAKTVKALAMDLGTVEGKLKLGLSAYGFGVTPQRVNATALSLKKAVRKADPERSVRIIPNNEPALNSAQVLHNGLTKPTGVELVVVRDGNTSLVAQTIQEQDIDAYAARDQGRPKRDARVGMLPPKLAQTIINLAAASTSPATSQVLLDPFCGTGVILQEAALMGFDVYGTDIDPRMVDYSDKNLDWLLNRPGSPVSEPKPGISGAAWRVLKLETGDATSHVWDPRPDIIACETYLGQPFSSLPTPEKLNEVRTTCNLILKKFLQNISSQLPSGTRLCLGVPAWQTAPGRFLHLQTLDHLEELGYNRVSFKHVETSDLVYARADQIVARELLVLTKR